MLAQTIVPIRILQRIADSLVEATFGRQGVKLPNVIRVENHVRLLLRLIEHEILHQELNIPDAAATLFEIEQLTVATIELLAHALPHRDHIVC